MKRKLMILCLSLMMVLTMIPANVWADEAVQPADGTEAAELSQTTEETATAVVTDESLSGPAEEDQAVESSEPEALPVQEETAESTEMTLTSTDEKVSVLGVFKDGTILNAEEIDNPLKASLLKRMALKMKSAKTASEANEEDLKSLNYIAWYRLELENENVQVQPDGTVLVTIKDLELPESGEVRVLHILDDVDAINNGIENETAVKVTDSSFVSKFSDEQNVVFEATGEENTLYVEMIDPEVVDDTTISFTTGSFSIYAIVDGTDEVPRATFNFKNSDDSTYSFTNTAGQTVDNQILKTDDEIEDVGTPEVPDGSTFGGWYVYVDNKPAAKVTFGKTVNVAFGETKSAVANADGTLTITITESDRNFDVKPYFGEVYTLTFYDDVEGRVILDMPQVPKGTEENPAQFSFNTVGTATVKEATTAFVGWTTVQGGTEPEFTSGSIINVTDDMTFYPVFKTGHWIYFVSAPEGSGATYVAPVFVPMDQPASTVKPETIPTWKNHTFIGWYTHNEAGEEVAEFDWNTVPDKDITLYGKWRADEVKYIISVYKQNVNDDKNASNEEKTYTFFKQYEMSAPAGTLKVYTPEEYKKLPETDKANFTGFVYNTAKSETEADLKADGSTNIKVYYDRVTITMNFIGYPGGTDTIYTYTALDPDDDTTRPQYGQLNGVYKQLTLGEPTTRYEYPGYTGTNYTGTTLYGNSGDEYFLLDVSSSSTYSWTYTAGSWWNPQTYTYTGTRYTRRNTGTWYNPNYVYTAVSDDDVDNGPYYTDAATGREELTREGETVYTFKNHETGEVYWTGIITNSDRPNLYTRAEVQIQTWLYDDEPYYGARYSQSSGSETGRVYTGLYGQSLEQNGYHWPGTDDDGNACYWQYEYNDGSLHGMSYLGEFVLPKDVADPNRQIINLHYNSLDDSSTVSFYLMDTDGEYSDTPNDNGIVSKGGTFYFSEKYDGFNVSQYRRYYMDGNTKVYVDKDGNVVDDPDAAWATAVVDANTPLNQLVNTGNNSDIYWYYTGGDETIYYNGDRFTGTPSWVNRNNDPGEGYVYTYAGEGSYSIVWGQNGAGYYPIRALLNAQKTTNNNGTQFARIEFDNSSYGFVQLTRGQGGKLESLNLEIRYARKQWNLNFVDSLDGHSSLTDSATGETIPSQTVYYNESLSEYEPASTVIPESSSAGYRFKGWFKDQACETPFVWTDTMPNADMNVYAGWEEEWFYVKLIPDGGTLLTSQATYFWENYGEKVVEYANITKNFVEDENGPYVYYFGEFNTADRDGTQATYRYALYFTNDGSKVVVENPDGTKTESENVIAYRDKKDEAGNVIYDEDGNRVQEPYPIPASTIYQYGVANGFIDTSKHYKYEKDAYALVGWYDVTDGTRKVYNFDGGVTQDTVLQAVWRRVGEFHIGYSTTGVDESGNPMDPAVNVTVADVPNDTNTYADNSDSAVLGVAKAPEGYTFMGWYYKGADEILQKGDAFTLKAQYADENKKIWLYPVFVKTENLPVQVTHILYDGNGGTTEMTSDEANHVVVNSDKTQIDHQNLQINAAQTLLGEDAFTRNGYTLKGWALNKNATKPDFSLGQENVAADNLNKTGNILYAVWEVKTYTVTVKKNVLPELENNTETFNFAAPGFGNNPTFTLKDKGEQTYMSVPYGTTFTVKEDAYTNYDTALTYTVTGADDTAKNVTDKAASNGDSFTVDGNITVTVTNTLKVTSLTIKKEGSSDSGQSFIFNVKGAEPNTSRVDMKVAVKENGSVTIDNLPVGKYTVTEEGGWSWRYTFGSGNLNGTTTTGNNYTLSVNKNTLTITNERTNPYWLSGDSYQKNVTGKSN